MREYSCTRKRFRAALRRVSRDEGFSVMELIVVVAIFFVIAAIALPNFTQTAKAANEAAAISYLRTWTTAQEMYHSRHGYYASSDSDLDEEGFISADSAPAGYIFRLGNPPGSRDRWWGSGYPSEPKVTGDRFFYIGSDGVIRFSTDGPAGLNSPPISSSPALAIIESD